MDEWAKLANEKIYEMRGSLNRTYEDNWSSKYEFDVNHIEPFAYDTTPLSGDYELFVDIKITSKNKKVETLKNIYLGSYYEKNRRDKIPFGQNFGEKYFKDTHKILINIIIESYAESLK